MPALFTIAGLMFAVLGVMCAQTVESEDYSSRLIGIYHAYDRFVLSYGFLFPVMLARCHRTRSGAVTFALAMLLSGFNGLLLSFLKIFAHGEIGFGITYLASATVMDGVYCLAE